MLQRRNRRPPMRADGRGARLRQEQADRHFRDQKKKQEERRLLEANRRSSPAPVLESLVDIEKVIENGPESPVYTLDIDKIDESMRAVGRAVFGAQGYNRVKTKSSDRDIGPHFDAYAAHFSPWTIHENHGTSRTVRAAFLPQDEWDIYLEDTEQLTKLGSREQSMRFEAGKKLIDSGCDVVAARLGHGALTLLWHGDITRPDLPPPNVHEYRQYGPKLNGIKFILSTEVQEPDGSYTIYAQQRVEGDFEGFVEV